MNLYVNVPGPPVPWQRTQGAGNRRFTPAKMRAYKAHVARCAHYAMMAAGYRAPWDGPVRLFCAVYLPDMIHRDWDNLGKAPSDALNGVVWTDDHWIVDARVIKHLDKANPRMELNVEFLDEHDAWLSPGRASALRASGPSSRTRRRKTAPLALALGPLSARR